MNAIRFIYVFMAFLSSAKSALMKSLYAGVKVENQTVISFLNMPRTSLLVIASSAFSVYLVFYHYYGRNTISYGAKEADFVSAIV